LRLKNEKHLRSYLLGTLPQKRAEQLEARLLKDDDLVEQLSLLEDELIEDYARNALSAGDRKHFERYFLTNPRRRRKLMLVRGLRKYTADVGHVNTADRSPARPPWYYPLLSPQWRPVAASLLIVLGSVTAWFLYSGRNDVDKGLRALNEAYKAKRPVEARVTGLNYAPFSATRGPNDVNARELDLSAALLHNAVSDNPSPKALHALGRLYLFNRDFDQAIVQFEEALKATPNDATLHSDLGAALLEKGKVERASDQSGRSEITLASSLEHLKRALQLDDSLLDARFNRALLYKALRLTDQALEDWKKYVTLDPNSRWADEARREIEEIKKRSENVSQRNEDLLVKFFDARKAGDQEKMWQLFSSAHLRTGNAITNKLIDIYLIAAATPGRSEEAAEWLQALTEVGKLSSDKTGDLFTVDVVRAYRSATPDQQKTLLQARQDIAAAYEFYNQSKHDLAISLYDRARGVFQEVGNRPEALLASFWMIFCFTERGDTQNSLSLLKQVEAECETRGYKWLQSITQIGLANVRERKTEYSQAAEHSWASYRASQQIADRNGELRSLNMLAGLYRDMGNYRRSLHMAQQGLNLGTEISAAASQMIGFYATSAWSLNSLGHYPAALEYETQALSLAEDMNNPLILSRYRVQMGLIQGMLKNYDEAIRNIRLGIEVGQGVGEETIRKEMSTYGQLYLGRAYRESGHFTEALATLVEVENFCLLNHDQLWLRHEVKKEQFLTLIAQHDVAAAREELTRVLKDYEDQRQRILEESNRKSFFDKEQSIYDVAIDFARSELSDPQQAFDYSENSRARSFLDTSTEGWRVVDEERIPDLRFSNALKPMPLDQIRQDLPDRAQLLQFAVLKEKLIIWYLSRDRFESTVVSVGGDELMEKVDRLLSLVTRPSNYDDGQLQRMSGELYDLLIGPLAQFLDRQKQLCIIPDKILHLLPFNILFSSSSQRYLIEDFALSYASSANRFVQDSSLATEKGTVRDEELLGVGNPKFDRKIFPDLDDLPSAAREVEDIRQFYNHASLLRGDEARKASVLNEMRNADVLHLATHYVPDANSPMLSKLVLAAEFGGQDRAQTTDGVLHAYEVFRLKPLRSRLAILAGCKTGVEEYVNGEGPIGLARPFNAAGVPLVIASLWPVDSQATTELMIEFHRLRKQRQYSSAEALRGAQVQMLKQGNTSHRNPYYWASFSLTGGYSDY
jgi:CHAT domain-containing protein